MKKNIYFFFLVLLPQCVFAQSVYIPLRISEEIFLDGMLNESSWKEAPLIDRFQQSDPHPGQPATEKTEARILYDDQYIYVGVKCYDSLPSKIISTNLERDPVQEDNDGVGIFFDTYHDRNTGIYFESNALGARYDADVAGNGGFYNVNYNTFWDVETKIDSDGYTLEFRIPLSSLRFQQKETVLMGVKIVRLVKHKNELVYFPSFDPKVQDPFAKVSLCADVIFKNLKSKKPVYLTPYAIANYNESYSLNPDGTAYEKNSEFLTRKRFAESETADKILSNIGADLKYGLTKNLTLDLTANTDFAQVEVDNRIINLTKYEINLPEKRTFFLESQNYLNMYLGYSGLIFNSRAIGREIDSNGVDHVIPIYFGARVTGKVKGLQFGALNMQTKGVDAYQFHAQNFTDIRFRQFFGKQGSFIGGIFTNRMSTDSKILSSRTAGPDFVIKLDEKNIFGGGAVATFDHSVHEKTFDDNVFYNLFYFHQSSEGFHHSSDFDVIQKHFVPEMGFIPENDILYLNTGNGWRFKINGDKKITFWYARENTNYTEKLASGKPETFFQNIETGILFKTGTAIDATPVEFKRDLIFSSWNIHHNIYIPEGYYKMLTADAQYSSAQTKKYFFLVYARYGDFYGGRMVKLNPQVNYIFNRYLKVNFTYQYVRIKFPGAYSQDGRPVYESHLVSGNFSVTLSTHFSIKLLAQYDNLSNSIGNNLRIRYNPKEGTDLFIVYNSGVNTDITRLDPHLPRFSNQAVTIKFSKTFGL
ncbi:MAG: DUF5916 domain-containing protein [Bacteroidetes bacterium]|nr:DUF5916 domain-containing protein [Bacteroidota bacterium]